MNPLVSWAQPVLSVFTILGAVVVSYFHNRMDSKMAERDNALLKTLDDKLEKFQTKDVADLQYQLQSQKSDNILGMLTEIKGSMNQRVEALEARRRGQN